MKSSTKKGKDSSDHHHEACEHSESSLSDSDRKVLNRLKRIEGQVRGLQRMVEGHRYCPEILVQVSAVQESLRSTAEVMLDGHLRHCVTDAVRSRDPERTEAVYRELTSLFRKYAK